MTAAFLSRLTALCAADFTSYKGSMRPLLERDREAAVKALTVKSAAQ